MGRLIDVNAVIKAIDKHTFDTDDGLCLDDDITCILEEVPTIEEHKTGKWVRHYSRPNVYADLCWHCSNCGYKTPDNWANKWKFCPNCGVRMMQEGEDND